jgi:uncharacterized protein involved in type VI secretion and phage assembly
MIGNLIIGLVTDRSDPSGLGRVKVQYPTLGDQVVSDWMRVASLLASQSSGTFFLPQVNDEVVVGFLQNNYDQPLMLGVLYNGVNRPSISKERQADTSEIRTISGSRITFADEKGKETITIFGSTGNQIEIDIANNKIAISATTGIEITGQKTITLSAESITINASQKLTLSGNAGVEINGGSEITASAAMIKLN